MSTPKILENPPLKPNDVLIGALLRVPAHAIHRRIVRELNAVGFHEINLSHIPVMQFPGPDGARPGELAERGGMSKQAMNKLLRSLEDAGYLVRSAAPAEGRMRIVRLTARGHAAYAGIYDILYGIELEWTAELGHKDFTELKRLLVRVWESPLSS